MLKFLSIKPQRKAETDFKKKYAEKPSKNKSYDKVEKVFSRQREEIADAEFVEIE